MLLRFFSFFRFSSLFPSDHDHFPCNLYSFMAFVFAVYIEACNQFIDVILSFLIVVASPASSTASPVIGVIDGKFESGYLVTVTIGTEKLKGVLYEAPQTPARQVPQYFSVITNNTESTPAAPTVHRRRRRKKSEIKKRDPAHPKPNRSGYNFFFAEQHARLKPLHPGKDREISRMIGELWTKLKENEKAVSIIYIYNIIVVYKFHSVCSFYFLFFKYENLKLL